MIRLDAREGGFADAFEGVVQMGRETEANVADTVASIIADVRARGDSALAELSRKFDGFEAEGNMRVETAEVDAAWDALEPKLRDAIETAAARIRRFHEMQRPSDGELTEEDGTRTGWRWGPVEAAGIYVPGGRAALFSSVLMNAIPAKVAGVERLVMTTPASGGQVNPAILAAARAAGVDEIYRVGGAQAIAALAYGTETVPAVDVIAGPGNAWVAEAKRQLFGRLGIDMVAGPSEILVVADAGADPAITAADLLSQAEHDPTSQSILMTDSAAFADAVEAALPGAFAALATAETARQSWEANGVIIVLGALGDAPPLIDRLAPEHLLLAVADPQPLFAAVKHAGSVFLGYLTPEAVGDYVAGPNHVLPTGRRARFSSGLGTQNFMKRTTYLSLSEAGFARLGPAAETMAEAEGLPAHARSVRLRGRDSN